PGRSWSAGPCASRSSDGAGVDYSSLGDSRPGIIDSDPRFSTPAVALARHHGARVVAAVVFLALVAAALHAGLVDLARWTAAAGGVGVHGVAVVMLLVVRARDVVVRLVVIVAVAHGRTLVLVGIAVARIVALVCGQRGRMRGALAIPVVPAGMVIGPVMPPVL